MITIVDLALHAASVCRLCRDQGRPIDLSDQEHGDQFRHPYGISKTNPCGADQIWVLIRKLEAGARVTA